MSKKRRSPKKLARSEVHAPPSESQAIESLTIFWSLCIFATLVFVIGVLLMWCSIAVWQLAGGPKDTLRAFADLLLFTSVVTGSVGGLLTPIVQSRRRRRVPKSLQIAAVAIAIAPWLLLALLLSGR